MNIYQILETLKQVEEASWINGKEEDPKSLRWKQTSMSYEEAVREFGADHVRKEGKARDGHEVIAVLVPLGPVKENDYVNINSVEDDEEYPWHGITDPALLKDLIADAQKWLESNTMASTEEFEHKQKELESHFNQLAQKMYSGAGGMPGGMEGMPDMAQFAEMMNKAKGNANANANASEPGECLMCSA